MHALDVSVLFFLFKHSYNGNTAISQGYMLGCSLLPPLLKFCSSLQQVRYFPSYVRLRGLSVLLLLCGDVSSNPDPVSHGMVNCRSTRNKAPLVIVVVVEHCFDVLSLVESLIRSVTLAFFNLHHKPRIHSHIHIPEN